MNPRFTWTHNIAVRHVLPSGGGGSIVELLDHIDLGVIVTILHECDVHLPDTIASTRNAVYYYIQQCNTSLQDDREKENLNTNRDASRDNIASYYKLSRFSLRPNTG
ncbi:uncharacterized protein ARMOST_08074 [Armillaria ostoyae]|uniref:Uncharacterized protein n=1 Tax=Armillaria ostoyae TaxID=47428 RepID=A0A284R7P0_ARMOS|nr:uncharacterized protein ARMOST_08074 [Armillaria ostoyae]